MRGVWSWPGCDGRCILLTWWEILGRPAESLCTTEYETLLADTPCVSDCCVQIQNLLEFCTGGQPPACPPASCSWYHRMGGVIYWGQESVAEGQRKLDKLLVSCLVEWGMLKAIQFLMLYFYRKAKIALIKRPLSKILCKGAFTNH